MIERLFVYGSLAPGGRHHNLLATIEGAWEPGTVRGHLHQAGWGSQLGYPGIIPNRSGPPVEGFVFSSSQLSIHWERLDSFEGDQYIRQEVTVETSDNSVVAFVYAIRTSPSETS